MTINAIGSSIPIEIAKGGTNASSLATNTGIAKFDGTRLVTSATATIDAANIMTNTAQPAFLVQVDSTISNVTGDGTNYGIVWDTETFDQGANMSATTFTAPATGRYLFTLSVVCGDIAAGNGLGTVAITASSMTSYQWNNPGVIASSGQTVMVATAIIPMTAADTATANIIISGGTKIVDIIGNSTVGASATYFAGYLIC